MTWKWILNYLAESGLFSYIIKLGLGKTDSTKEDDRQSAHVVFSFLYYTSQSSALEMIGKTLLDGQKC